MIIGIWGRAALLLVRFLMAIGSRHGSQGGGATLSLALSATERGPE
jgi:hypothetical protein